MKQNIEILAPAGSYESFRAAIAAGADAVYVGGSRFGARAYADNFTKEQLLTAVDEAHLHGRKLFLTVNTLLKEQEIAKELYDYLLPFYEQGLDAVIVQDVGVLHFVRAHFPGLPIHASTQMTITNVLGAQFLKDQGVERVVTARELHIDEIREIVAETGLEIESFVHGALCYCYSGQCLFSSLLGGRSGNRGQCAQPCRLPYEVEGKQSYVLSLKDICTLDYIPEMIEAGIYSFKIEGRMKKPEYVAAVTSMYRKYVDRYYETGKESFAVDSADKQLLMDIYNRGGFNGGYYHTKNGKEMLSLTRPNHAGVPAVKVLGQRGRELNVQALTDLGKGDVLELSGQKENYTLGKEVKQGEQFLILVPRGSHFSKGSVMHRTRNRQLLDHIRETVLDRKVQERIKGSLNLSAGNPAILKVSCRDTEITVTGDVIQEAQNQPLKEQRIRKQMEKTGNSNFVFAQLAIQMEDNIFVPMQKLNELRRRALDELEKAVCEAHRRTSRYPFIRPTLSAEKRYEIIPGFSVSVETKEQLKAVGEYASVSRVYLDCSLFGTLFLDPEIADAVQRLKEHNKEVFLAMPHIFRQETAKRYAQEYTRFYSLCEDGVLIRNYESCQFLKEHKFDKKVILDHNLYIFNRYAKEFWNSQGVLHFTAPLELNCKELDMLGIEDGELLVYGHLPMMISAQCVRKTVKGCEEKPGILKMKDRFQKEIPVKNYCSDCYNIIYNYTPLSLADQRPDIDRLHAQRLRLSFTLEEEEQVRPILDRYSRIFIDGQPYRETGEEFTRGHFKRGIK